MTSDITFNSSFTGQSFHAFSIQHILVQGIIAVLCVLVVWATRRNAFSDHKWLRLLLGFCLIGYAGVFYVYQGIEHALSWKYSLPLDICSLVLIACVFCLFRPSQFAFEIAYFWGLGGVLQAMATPDLATGFPSWEFILFFWGHGATLLAIVFFLAGRNFRPRSNSVLNMMIALNIYALVVGAVNAIMGWNYGYLCQKPAVPSLLDFLGPWPWYLLSLEFIAFLTFLLLILPWKYRSINNLLHI